MPIFSTFERRNFKLIFGMRNHLFLLLLVLFDVLSNLFWVFFALFEALDSQFQLLDA